MASTSVTAVSARLVTVVAARRQTADAAAAAAAESKRSWVAALGMVLAVAAMTAGGAYQLWRTFDESTASAELLAPAARGETPPVSASAHPR